jgi:hypothetical protein
MRRITYILLGVLMGLFGLGIFINPIIYHTGLRFNFDFTEIKWPFGGGLILLGLFFIWTSFRKKTIEAEKKAKDDKKVLMCPKCIKPFYKKDCQDLICPECQGPLEELSGFYERHPELKVK